MGNLFNPNTGNAPDLSSFEPKNVLALAFWFGRENLLIFAIFLQLFTGFAV
jgi:hypothetical protein